jgi:hypothetical protein
MNMLPVSAVSACRPPPDAHTWPVHMPGAEAVHLSAAADADTDKEAIDGPPLVVANGETVMRAVSQLLEGVDGKCSKWAVKFNW